MTINVKKLQKKLVSNGFFADKFYQKNGYCTMIDCYVVSTGQKFILTVPGDYEMYIDPDSDTFSIKSVVLPDMKNSITEEYENDISNFDVAEQYESDLPNVFENEEDISNTLSKEYNYEIPLEEDNPESIRALKDVYRQLERLKYTVNSGKYSLGIFYKNYIFKLNNVKNRRSVISIDQVMNSQGSKFEVKDTRHLFITIDIEDFFESLNSVIDTMDRIKVGIDKILSRNYRKQIGLVQSMTNKCISSIRDFNTLYAKNNQLKMTECELKSHYKTISGVESGAIKKLQEHMEYSPEDATSISILNNDVKNIEDTKSDIVNNMMDINEKTSNISLGMDKIMFDNLVLFNSIITNFSILKEIYETSL